MKSRHLFIDLIRPAAAVITLATMLVAQPGFILAASYETVSILKLIEFRFNLQPLAARDADSAVNDLVDAFTE